ncbi:hypothetical protein GQX74_004765 [Glossina fuscipes]|uniref:Uncharacterized protein n=1 Tax=Glossina palpalis gambiensis TaxID=67801 RepID=A0A1B0BCS2_9MUSC|nr:hypothetical protein GQX74_004765 [Glossina fuscipes]
MEKVKRHQSSANESLIMWKKRNQIVRPHEKRWLVRILIFIFDGYYISTSVTAHKVTYMSVILFAGNQHNFRHQTPVAKLRLICVASILQSQEVKCHVVTNLATTRHI